jgi:hypothetical protein
MQTRMLLWGTWLVILAVYIGFAGAWGALTRQPYCFRTWLSVGFGLLVILPASLALPFVIYGKLLAWGAAQAVSVFFLPGACQIPWLAMGAPLHLLLLWRSHIHDSGLDRQRRPLAGLVVAGNAGRGGRLPGDWEGLPVQPSEGSSVDYFWRVDGAVSDFTAGKVADCQSVG